MFYSFIITDADSPLIQATDKTSIFQCNIPLKNKNTIRIRANSLDLSCGFLSAPFVFAKWADIHIYSSSDDVLFANTDFVAFHVVIAGRKKIVLPKKCDVVDIFSGEVIARDCDEFTFSAELHDSRLFYCGNAEKFTAALKQPK